MGPVGLVVSRWQAFYNGLCWEPMAQRVDVVVEGALIGHTRVCAPWLSGLCELLNLSFVS